MMGRTRKHVKNPINLTLRSKFKVVSGLRMYATHRLMVIHSCVKYGKPMSNQKKSYRPDTNLHRQTDIQTDGQTERHTDRVIPIYPLNFVHRGYNYIKSDDNF